MGFFSKKDTPNWLDGMMYEYKQLLNDKDYPLSHVFEYYSNDGKDYIYKEKANSRNVFLLRNKNCIALKEFDDDENVLFYAERECSLYTTSEPKIVKIIHELYVEEFKSRDK